MPADEDDLETDVAEETDALTEDEQVEAVEEETPESESERDAVADDAATDEEDSGETAEDIDKALAELRTPVPDAPPLQPAATAAPPPPPPDDLEDDDMPMTRGEYRAAQATQGRERQQEAQYAAAQQATAAFHRDLGEILDQYSLTDADKQPVMRTGIAVMVEGQIEQLGRPATKADLQRITRLLIKKEELRTGGTTAKAKATLDADQTSERSIERPASPARGNRRAKADEDEERANLKNPQAMFAAGQRMLKT